MAELFWLSNEQWAVMEPFMPKNQPGPERNDDRQVISGILHVVRTGCRWCDCPAEYGPSTTVYNRFNRWSRRGFWKAMLAALAKAGWTGEANAIDATYVRAHRSAQGGKGGHKAQGIGPSRGGQTTKIHALVDIVGRPAVLRLTPGNASDVKTAPDVLAEAPGRIRRLIADKGYDANWLRKNLRERNTTPIIPGTHSRKRKIRLDKKRYRERWRVEAMRVPRILVRPEGELPDLIRR
ncbi:IS5 family transposase, partial [Methylorubrum aminovorans]|uniref:IS5 family transposase n=1 Tax=Methylorubrum aminovorans TaxID=269069 RepID=UPI0031DE080D